MSAFRLKFSKVKCLTVVTFQKCVLTFQDDFFFARNLLNESSILLLSKIRFLLNFNAYLIDFPLFPSDCYCTSFFYETVSNYIQFTWKSFHHICDHLDFHGFQQLNPTRLFEDHYFRSDAQSCIYRLKEILSYH